MPANIAQNPDISTTALFSNPDQISVSYLTCPGQPGKVWTVRGLCTIGSDSSCGLVLSSPEVAERHCRIESRGHTWLVRDLRSGQATRVNRTTVVEAFISEGDELQIGPHIFRFSLTETPTANSTSLRSKNPEWEVQLNLLANVAKSQFPILLLGPSGSGKEVVSESVHQNSLRSDGPLVKVNCSALSETLVESELFGHTKGSFTGAVSDRKGAFEAARGGTLFLDEIGDLPLSIQAKLLRALENNEIRPVGADRTIRTDVRIIAATHQNLRSKIQTGEFRADLYFRLNVISVQTPALSARMEDFDDILMQFSKLMRVRFLPEAVIALRRHRWPGNIRELKNVVARASALFPGVVIGEQHLSSIVDAPMIPLNQEQQEQEPDRVRDREREKKENQGGQGDKSPMMREFEKQIIMRRLAANNGNQRKTAIDLGIPKSTLFDRIRAYQIDPRQFTRPVSYFL